MCLKCSDVDTSAPANITTRPPVAGSNITTSTASPKTNITTGTAIAVQIAPSMPVVSVPRPAAIANITISAPAPADATVTEAEIVALEFIMGGKSVNQLMMSVADFSAAIASAAGVPTENVTVGTVTAVRAVRRLLSDIVKVSAGVSGVAADVSTSLRANTAALTADLEALGLDPYRITMTMVSFCCIYPFIASKKRVLIRLVCSSIAMCSRAAALRFW
jgi:hypothetical protein